MSQRSVQRYLELFQTTGEVVSRRTPVHKLRKLSEFEQVEHLLNTPGVYLREVQEKLHSVTGTWVHCSIICRLARKCGLTRQKLARISIQQSEDLIAEFIVEINQFNPCSLLMKQDQIVEMHFDDTAIV